VSGWPYVVRLFLIGPEDSQVGSALSTFTPSAKRTLELARAEAPRFYHDFIGTEHVLLGLLTLENDAASNVLRRFGVDREAVRMEIEKLVEVGPGPETTPAIPFTPRVRKAFVLAAREAKAMNHAQIGTEHIILGLLIEGSGVAALVLKNLGLDIERTRAEICKMTAAGS
jgi:ATP-dependent Clp protease ATP-binding subunit ClpC